MSYHFGKYSVLYRLGTGGMAEVFKCRLSGIGGFAKLVVIKRIKPELAGEQTFMDMFLDEARIAANLQHPNVVQIFEIDEVDGLPYIAMEYVRGPTLALLNREERKRGARLSLAPSGPPRAAVIARVMAGICAGLSYAHRAIDERGAPLAIIHRDVSPQNIIVSMDGVPKLLDFGVAKARGQLAQTTAGAIKGKLKFMAPEQFVVGGQLTPAVDLFAAGVCLYEAMTLQLPYSGETELDVMRAAAAGRFSKPTELVPDLDPRLEELILWAMANSPSERCPDARTLQLALEDYADRAHCTQADVARYIAELFPTAAAEHGRSGELQSPYVEIESKDIIGPGNSAVRVTEVQRPRQSPPQRSLATGPLDSQGDLGLAAARAAEDAAELYFTPPPRESRAPVWGAVASVALIALFSLGIALGRQKTAVIPVPLLAQSGAPDAGTVAAAAVTAAAVKPAPPKPDALLRAAHEALDQGRYVESAELARRVLSEHFDEPRATALLLEATSRERERQTRALLDNERDRERDRDRERAAAPPPKSVAPPPPAPISKVRSSPKAARRVAAIERAIVESEPASTPTDTDAALKTPGPEALEAPPPVPPPAPVEAVRPPLHPLERAAAEVAPPVEAPVPSPSASPLARVTVDCPDDTRLVRASPLELWCEVGHDREGPYLRLWPNGRKAIEGEFRRGKKHGWWVEYYEQGGERARVQWRRGVQLW